MIDGISLTLLVGPMVPVPVPKVVLDALTDVEVSTSTQGPSAFQLRFIRWTVMIQISAPQTAAIL